MLLETSSQGVLRACGALQHPGPSGAEHVVRTNKQPAWISIHVLIQTHDTFWKMKVYSSLHITLRNVFISVLVELCQQINSNRLATARGWNLKSAKPSLTPKSILQTIYFAHFFFCILLFAHLQNPPTQYGWRQACQGRFNTSHKRRYLKKGKKASNPNSQTFHRRRNKIKSKQAVTAKTSPKIEQKCWRKFAGSYFNRQLRILYTFLKLADKQSPLLIQACPVIGTHHDAAAPWVSPLFLLGQQQKEQSTEELFVTWGASLILGSYGLPRTLHFWILLPGCLF